MELFAMIARKTDDGWVSYAADDDLVPLEEYNVWDKKKDAIENAFECAKLNHLLVIVYKPDNSIDYGYDFRPKRLPASMMQMLLDWHEENKGK